MVRHTLLSSLCIASFALAAGKGTPKAVPSSSELKAAMGGIDAGTPAAKDPNAPDVSKLPFTQTSIRTVVSYHQPQIQSCYEETLAGRDKVVEGKLQTSFVITGEGLVKNARVEKKNTTLREPRLHECVVAVLSAMTFPKPIDGKDHPIEYPFNLKAIK